MRRFRLKTLLVFVTLLCVALAAWKTNRVWWPYLIPVGDTGLDVHFLVGRPLAGTTTEHLLVSRTDRFTFRVVTDKDWVPSLVVRGDEDFRTEIATEPTGLAGNRMTELTIEISDNQLVVSNRNGHPLFVREISTKATPDHRFLHPVAGEIRVASRTDRVDCPVGSYYHFEPTGDRARTQSYRFEIRARRD